MTAYCTMQNGGPNAAVRVMCAYDNMANYTMFSSDYRIDLLHLSGNAHQTRRRLLGVR
jgi:hypothetical protein